MAAGSLTALVRAQHRQALAVALAILAAGCDAREVASDHKAGVAVVSAATIAEVAKPSAVAPAAREVVPKDGNSVVRRVDPVSLSATAIPAPPPLGLLPTRKTFSTPRFPPNSETTVASCRCRRPPPDRTTDR
uniref:hypothetical protein n=1 Tax=uncultured Sphingomonas sp. TaxID=158754 RepID=UPI0035CAAA5F